MAAEKTSDVVAAVNFARERRLRLVVKGGGHSYQGTSCAPDSLLVWTRRMNDVVLHDSFVPRGCDAVQAPQPAVTLGSGAMWIDAYDAVTTRGGRYADGQVCIANACSHPDLFWALKGGGGGTLGVVTRLTLRTRELPEYFGAVFGAITASTDAAYRELIDKMLGFYRGALFNPHWGEQLIFRQDNTLRIAMVFQGLRPQEAEAAWAPLLDWVRTQPALTVHGDLSVRSLPARQFWNAGFFDNTPRHWW